MAMDCRPLLCLSASSLCVLSPDGLHFAVASAGRVAVRAVSDLDSVSHMLQCVDKIDKIDFSSDSKLILCAMYGRQAVQVFSLEDPEWKCRINESAAGLISAGWTPDPTILYTESDFGIQISLWSLTNGNQSVISFPKPSQRQFRNQFVAFSPCKRFISVVHRMELQDMIGVYSISPSAEIIKFKARSSDVNVVFWLPSGHIATLDSPLSYKCCVYSPSGEVRGV
jgi:WD40 repeat protein